MIRLTAILLLVFLSCREPKTRGNDSVGIDSAEMTNVTALLKSDGPTFSMDEIYQKFINQQLQEYLKKKHPKWSVPSQNKWYPKLFDKYKTDSALVNYLSGDFDCNGTKDCALLLDKGNRRLAAVAFLSNSDSFRTVELTELSDEGDKINWRLTLFRPGKYNTADPDVDSNDRYVTFKCPAIGIGYFKELYEGGRDVYYWDNRELRSCLIDE